ncbi:LysR substrate-binding domain-containing protein [Pseudomonas japonica]|uniref:Transcriptional regulator, LysR family n=1 Tax=Pseudomonas japonica TaxID=256466 RepID=A0A239BE26_9PSED|nr:LysR substrate-binding domain-containing protein [Pseudomonas japonica]SNS05811.1 transcriptional regulator, LysR family [Pseudomonas japonica]
MFLKLPLTSLRAFESAARLGGFKAASEELAVTSAAISHQVKALEVRLSTHLFERTGQGVRLTSDGQRLYDQVHMSFIDISHSLDSLQPHVRQDCLTITTTPAFASLWLIPRLGEFYRRHPSIRVRVETSNEVTDLLRKSSVDIAIRCSVREYPDLHQLPLMQESFCAYSPSGTIERDDSSPIELINVHWRTPSSILIDWEHWLIAANRSAWLNKAILREYDDEHYALQAAISGYGAVLASTVLVADSVARGLLKPCRPEIRLPGARYIAVCIPGRERKSPVKEFMDWLAQEALAAESG